CRAWAPARSACRERRRRRSAGCRASRAEKPSRRSRCQSPKPVPTWPACNALPASKATMRCSMARRPGSPTAASPTSTWCSAAPALGFARRALDEALQRATTRKMFNGTLADFQLTQAKLAQMAMTIDSAALLVYRAAWMRDQGRTVTKEAAMAKMAATEGAQQVIDAAVQIFGGMGVQSEQVVERLYREIRPLRIYEGASEVQQLIIARELLKELRT